MDDRCQCKPPLVGPLGGQCARCNKYSDGSPAEQPRPSSFPEMEVRATVALDGGTRRACNNENCSQDYQHQGQCDPTPVHMPPRGVIAGTHKESEDVTLCLPNGDRSESAEQVVASEPLQPAITRSGPVAASPCPICGSSKPHMVCENRAAVSPAEGPCPEYPWTWNDVLEVWVCKKCKLIPPLDSKCCPYCATQPVLGAKVEEIARKVCSELYLCFGTRHLIVSQLLEKSNRELVVAILRPYFLADATQNVANSKYLKLLKWFKLFYGFFQDDVKDRPSAAASAMSEDSELQEFVKEAQSL